MTTEPGPMKFCIVIVPSTDGDRLLTRMAEQGFPATRIGSTGGFLKRGSATVFSALSAERVPELVALLHTDFPEVTERMPAATLPFMDDLDAPSSALVDVRVGGAVLFVLPLDRMERV
ncbi:MAG: cyclic-di-AMP receptor [Dehalococcoidia bacterium]